MEVVAEKRCAHCQTSFSGGGLYCCPGCQGVAALIHASGLNEFYRILGSRNLTPARGERSQIPWDNYVVPFSENLSTLTVAVEGLTCSACVWLLDRLSFVNRAVVRVDTDFSEANVKIFFKKAESASQVIASLESLGFRAKIPDMDQVARRVSLRRKWILRVAVAFFSFLGSMHLSLMLYGGYLEGMDVGTVFRLGILNFLVTLPAILYSAISFYVNAWRGIKGKSLSVDLIVTVSIIVGTVLSVMNLARGINEIYFDAVSMLVFMLLLGRTIVFTIENAFKSRSHFFEQEIFHSPTLTVGQTVAVASGSSFPCDGKVVGGESLMSASWLTGEEKPTPISAGSEVLCGALNIGDQVVVRVEKILRDTQVGHLFEKLKAGEKGKYEAWGRALETTFVFSVLAALAVLSFWFKDKINPQLLVALLLVSCPCAFGVGIPLIFASYFRQALKRGILVKGAAVLEKANKIKHIVFDKTGTLTFGIPQVSKVIWNDPLLSGLSVSKEEIGDLIATVSRRSDHPVMKGLRSYFASNEVPLLMVESLGQGVSGSYKGLSFRIGNANYVGARKTDHTSVFISLNGIIVSVVKLEASLRPSALSTVQRLRRRYQMSLLSGDTNEEADRVANILGIECHGNQNPEMKLETLKRMQEKDPILMVGDGVNDSLAMKEAALAVGMSGGAVGSLDVCDVFLKESNLDLVPAFLDSCLRVKCALAVVFGFSILYNGIGMFLVLQGFLGPLVCAILMPLSSITVMSLVWFFPYFREAA